MMRVLTLSIILVITAISAPFTYAQPGTNPKAAIIKAFSDSIRAYQAGDLERYMSFWVDSDATTLIDPVSHKLLLGTAAIRNYVATAMQSPGTLNANNYTVTIEPKSQLAWLTATIDMTYITGGNITTRELKWVAARLINTGSEWKIVLMVYPFYVPRSVTATTPAGY